MAIFSSPFLTDIDPQAAVKGSRDPLGIQTIWSHLGRHVVGNLTTVTTSVRDFTSLVLGYYFVERVADLGGTDEDLAVFLKWEQLAAHVRYRINQDEYFRGIERVKKAASEDDIIRLGTDPSCQILGNQRTYGLWGLYTGPARASGLVNNGDPTRLTPAGRQLVEEVYLPALTKAGRRNADRVVALLVEPKVKLDATGRDRPFLESVAEIWPDRRVSAERAIYDQHLLRGIDPDRTQGRQAALATALQDTIGDVQWQWSPARVGHLAKICRGLGPAGEEAAFRLERIRVAEALLAPAADLFNLVLANNDQTLADVARATKTSWNSGLKSLPLKAISELEPELRDAIGDKDASQRWLQIAEYLANGNYVDAIKLLIDQNAFVMKARAGTGAWVELSKDRLKARFLDAGSNDLRPRRDIPDLWRHSYFLDAMRMIAMDLKA